jgi:hypothetical protein
LDFYGIIEDCSLSGVKLKLNKQANNGSMAWSELLQNIENLESGNSVTLTIPTSLEIENGKTIGLSTVYSNKIGKETDEKKKPEKTISLKKNSLLEPKVKNKVEDCKLQALKGKIAWTSAESGEWFLGVEIEDQTLSKRLFEAIVYLQSRQQKGSQSQNIMKTRRIA